MMTFHEFAGLLNDRVQIADIMSMGPRVVQIVRASTPPGVERVATTIGLFDAMTAAAGGLTARFLDELERVLTIGNPMALTLATIDPIDANPVVAARSIDERDRIRRAWPELHIFAFPLGLIDRNIWLAPCGRVLLYGLTEELPPDPDRPKERLKESSNRRRPKRRSLYRNK
jgi:hypothetical protein